MSEPRTEAGKRLLAQWRRDPKELWTVEQVVAAILAIEAEAARSERVPDGLRTALTDLITVAEAQPHDPGSMLGVALANARTTVRNAWGVRGTGAYESAPAPSERVVEPVASAASAAAAPARPS
jgi:hypothetical protein